MNQRRIERGDCLVVNFISSRGANARQLCVTVDSEGNIALPFGVKPHISGATLQESALLIRDAYIPNESNLSVQVIRCR